MQSKIKYDRGFFFVQVRPPDFEIPDENADKLINNKLQRDCKEWHITIITAKEFNNIVKQFVEKHRVTKREAESAARISIIERFNNEIKSNPKELGVGKVEVGENVAYFVVIEWEEVQEFRKSFGLDEKDFHVTLGFGEDGDIHDVPKGKDSLVKLNELKNFISKVLERNKKIEDVTMQSNWDQLYKN